MKFVFLDVDGVLNSKKWFGSKKIRDPEEKLLVFEQTDFLSPENIKNFNCIIDRTGAQIILISSWRLKFTLPVIKAVFREAGVKGNIVGITPKLSFKETDSPVPRGNEIKVWIEDNKHIHQSKVTKLNYVILDDESNMLFWQRNRFVHTDRKVGLTCENAKQAIKILNN